MSKRVHPTATANAAIEAAREALAEERPQEAMLMIGRVAQDGHVMLHGDASFRVVL